MNFKTADFFVMLLVIGTALFVEQMVSKFIDYHWIFSAIFIIPVVLILGWVYQKIKRIGL